MNYFEESVEQISQTVDQRLLLDNWIVTELDLSKPTQEFEELDKGEIIVEFELVVFVEDGDLAERITFSELSIQDFNIVEGWISIRYEEVVEIIIGYFLWLRFTTDYAEQFAEGIHVIDIEIIHIIGPELGLSPGGPWGQRAFSYDLIQQHL